MSLTLVAKFAVAAIFASAALASAGVGLRGGQGATPAPIADILAELQGALGSELAGVAESRVTALEDAMRPIYSSLPKTTDGLLPAAGVRYLLHRVLVARHTWFVRGIENTGEGWDAGSPTAPFSEGLCDAAGGLFRRRLGSGGLSLREAAAMAATLESLVYGEFRERLDVAYLVTLATGVDRDLAEEDEVSRVIDNFMVMYVLGADHHSVTPSSFTAMSEKIRRYSNWNNTRAWVREIREEVVSAVPAPRTSYSATTQVVQEVMDRYGRWQNHECSSLKRDLLELEWNGTGRARLQDFYAAALRGKWLFSEKEEYLRDQGCLDESTPSGPSVLIANYVNAPANCLAESKYYSVCCLNECEELMGPIEHQISAPEATPEEIVRVVERLPSATVSAPRALPANLLARLVQIAVHHGGRVPIHGRLFAQWMHHAYPRECPFPHVAGSTSPLRGREWETARGERSLLTKAAMRERLQALTRGEESDDARQPQAEAGLPWTPEEELVVVLPAGVAAVADVFSGDASIQRALRLVRLGMKAFAPLSLGVVVLNTARGALSSATGLAGKEKCIV